MPVRQVASTRTARYRAVPSKIDRRRSISAVGGRLSEKKGRRRRRGKRRKKKRKEEKKNTYRPRAVLARALSPLPPVGAFSPARGERSRR
ncbi:hypothetical protein BHM03_00027242, partial [Ensete ventricosum]